MYQLNRAHLLICIFAGFVLTGGFVWHLFFDFPYTLFSMALWVSSAIVLFYFLGLIARSFLISQVFVPEEEYDFSQDEEYLAFMEGLENKEAELSDVMLNDPLEGGEPMMDYDDSIEDPFMEPESLTKL